MKYIENKKVKSLIFLTLVFLLSPLVLSFTNEESNDYYKNIPDISTLSKSDLNLPSSYDLRDVNGVNYTTPLKNQGIYPLCWAFAATTSIETSLKKSGYVDPNFNEWFSPYQVDVLVSPDVKTPDINYVKTKEHSFASGEDISELGLAYKAFTTGYSPVLMSNFDEKKYTSQYKIINKYKFYAEDVYNESYTNYYVTDFDILYENNDLNAIYDNSIAPPPKINDLELVDIVKYYLYNYGGVIVSTITPSSYCDVNSKDCYMKSNKNQVNDGFHMMTIIGWDDNKRAWILQNSWGEKIPNIYLSYDSFVIGYIGIKGISSTNLWDNRYYGTTNYNNIAAYKKIPDNDEIIDSILVEIPTSGSYNLYLSNDSKSEDFELIKTFNAYFKGRKTLDLSSEHIVLDNDSFNIKIENVDTDEQIKENIYVFTKDLNNDSSKKIYLYDIYDINSALQTFSIKYKGINLEKNKLSFKIKDEVDNDVTNNFNLISQYYSNNYGQLDYNLNFENQGDTKEYKVEAIYDGNVIATKKFYVMNFKNFEKGSGTEEDPFIITKPSDFEIILSDPRFLNYSYKLGKNIDMAGVNFTPIGSTGTPFTGIFDGNNYTIKNLNLSEKKGFFGDIEDAVIKNIRFENGNINTTSNSSGFVVGISRSSFISNIYISGGNMIINSTSYKGSYGTLIGSVYNTTKVEKIYSSMNVTMDKIGIDCKIGGLIGNIAQSNSNNFSSVINSSYEGEMNFNNDAKYIITGGIVGKNEESNLLLKNIKIGNKFNILNKLNLNSVGYFIGSSLENNKKLMNSLFFNKPNIEGIRLIGNQNNSIDDYENIYGIVDTEIINNDRYINKNLDLFLKQSTYNLDFKNIWYMSDNGPEIRLITLNLIDKSDVIGETNIYNIDYDNFIISNIKSNNGSITKKEFIDDFITFSGDIYTSDNQLIESDNDKIKTGMIVRKNDKDYKIAVKGDVNDDGRINSLDIIILRRAIAGGYDIRLEDYQTKAADVNEDGKINTLDIIHLRRAIAGGYDDSCQLIWRTCE